MTSNSYATRHLKISFTYIYASETDDKHSDQEKDYFYVKK